MRITQKSTVWRSLRTAGAVVLGISRALDKNRVSWPRKHILQLSDKGLDLDLDFETLMFMPSLMLGEQCTSRNAEVEYMVVI